MLKSIRILVLFVALTGWVNCEPGPKPVFPFILYISNQSFVIDPVDIMVELDDEIVVNDNFRVGDAHRYTPYFISIKKGKHSILVWSEWSNTLLSKSFELDDQDTGILIFWCSPESQFTDRPAFTFDIQKGPPLID